MTKRLVAQKLINRLNEKIRRQLDLRETLVLGVVLKGLPIAYGLVKMNNAIKNFVPLVAQRHMYLQHQVESYFPSLDWKSYLQDRLGSCRSLLIVDDVLNTGFTRQRVESILFSLGSNRGSMPSFRFAALVLNVKNLASPSFIERGDFFALKVHAADVECDWGLVTVPLWDLSVSDALQVCEQYYRKFWQSEKRWITITY